MRACARCGATISRASATGLCGHAHRTHVKPQNADIREWFHCAACAKKAGTRRWATLHAYVGTAAKAEQLRQQAQEAGK